MSTSLLEWCATYGEQVGLTNADTILLCAGFIVVEGPHDLKVLRKFFWSELDVELHATALRLLGERGELVGAAPCAVNGGSWMSGYLFSLAGPIYAGTNEIQRNIIAERVLGLPRK